MPRDFTPHLEKKLFVCAHCLCAACWQGEFFCENSLAADIKVLTVKECLALGRENPDYILRGAQEYEGKTNDDEEKQKQ